MLNRTWIPGEAMSVSTTPTRCPRIAINAARLAVVLDLPVPPRNEWTEMILDMMGSLVLVCSRRLDRPKLLDPIASACRRLSETVRLKQYTTSCPPCQRTVGLAVTVG